MRVGTSQYINIFDLSVEDHPHACGDKLEPIKAIGFKAGSSPCVWGQAKIKQRTIFFFRIIPMRVGTSEGAYSSFDNNRDHPHACGDK